MALDTARAVATLRSLTVVFDEAVKTAQPFWPEICTEIMSDGADEEYGKLGSLPGVREWLGDRQFNTLRAGKFTIANKKWESSVRIEKDDLADDRMSMYGPILAELGDEASYHPDELVFSLVNNGNAQACFDNQYFFDTDHSWGDSGTQSNSLTYNAADHTAVTATEFKAAFHAARKSMLTFKNDQGKYLTRPVMGKMASLVALVPPELQLAAEEAVQSIIISNSTNVVLDRPRVVASPHLTSAVRFYLLNTAARVRPFVFQKRAPLTRSMKGLDDLEFKDVKFMTEARYNAGYGAWWTAVMTEFN